jgi:hypothetical protein
MPPPVGEVDKNEKDSGWLIFGGEKPPSSLLFSSAGKKDLEVAMGVFVLEN